MMKIPPQRAMKLMMMITSGGFSKSILWILAKLYIDE
jgi:hypothetical protein